MAHLANLEAAIDACANQLEHLNNQFPHLSSTATLQGVEQWRGRRARPPVRQAPAEPSKPAPESLDMRAIATSLVAEHTLEDAQDLLLERHKIDIPLPELVHLIGRKTYVAILKRDLHELLKNAISYEQIANLWNDLDRPALGNEAWNSRMISLLDA